MATWSPSGSSAPPHPDFLSALSLTHVQYHANDPLSLAMAYASLVPLGLLCAYATWIVARRELTAVLMLAGQLGNEVVNFACKAVVAQHRPTSFLGTGYGMPSSHAQFMAFFAVFGILHLHTYVGIRGAWWKLLVDVALVAITGMVAYSRVYLWYHTSYQVLAGLVAGSVVAVGYFVVLRYGVRRRGWAQWFIQTPLARYLYLRDPAEIIPHLLQREYAWHCQEAAHAYKQD